MDEVRFSAFHKKCEKTGDLPWTGELYYQLAGQMYRKSCPQIRLVVSHFSVVVSKINPEIGLSITMLHESSSV